MDKTLREQIAQLEKERKSLPDCEKRRTIDTHILNLKKELRNQPIEHPEILVKFRGKVVGFVKFDRGESSFIFNENNGSKTEVGFQWHEVRGWASMNGFQLKVEA